jgi:agmatine/peptidylarginine deiminase
MKKQVYLLIISLFAFFPSGMMAQQILNTPPNAPLRTMAEWEEIQALVVTWRDYKSTLAEIIRYAQEECRVIVHVPSTSSVSAAQNELTNTYNVPLGPNVSLISQPSNSLWIRDYGANSVYMNDVDSLFLVDWKYNRPSRVQDDTIPRRYARELGLNLVQTTVSPNTLIHTGGNFMSDGFGTAFSSNLILDENPSQTEAGIDQLHLDYMGIDRYIKMPTLPYDGIHHIDMHVKLLDEETLLWSQYPTGVADGPQIEANLLYVLDNFNSVFGTPYKIRRIVAPPDYSGNGTPIYPNNNGDYRTYSNTVFVNKKVLLPIYNSPYDTTAVRIYSENLPGYEIVPINCTNIIAASGAIHCITHSVGVNDPLLISHQPLSDTYDTQNPYIVNALMKHRSGIASAQLYYTTDTLMPYSVIDMIPGTTTDTWTAAIPAQAAGTTVYYYVRAVSESGKIQVRPITSPDGWWSFRVLSDVVTQSGTAALDAGLYSNLFPNPSEGLTCLELRAPRDLQVDVRVWDASGRMLETLHIGKLAGPEQRLYLNAPNYAKGVYLIELHTTLGSRMLKWMVR